MITTLYRINAFELIHKNATQLVNKITTINLIRWYFQRLYPILHSLTNDSGKIEFKRCQLNVFSWLTPIIVTSDNKHIADTTQPSHESAGSIPARNRHAYAIYFIGSKNSTPKSIEPQERSRIQQRSIQTGY